ncbi:transposase [Bacillus sp. FJAT-47783]|uniref:transposase n=1 Tax=Bacillus sp. FJAT-47783 TaxID=2922712 RepID=UPI001FAC4228
MKHKSPSKSEAKRSLFPSFHELCKALETWKTHILTYFELPYKNVKTEGTNHKIKNRKRISYGFRNMENFRIRVKQNVLKVKVPLLHLFTL